MSVSGGAALCLRRVFVSNVMSSTRLKSTQILAEVRNESDFREREGAERAPRRRSWMPACAGKTVWVWVVVMVRQG